MSCLTVAFSKLATRRVSFWPPKCSGCAAVCCPKVATSNPEGEKEEEMRLPSAGGAGGGVHCYMYACPYVQLLQRKKYKDETHRPSTGVTDGGAGC